MQLPDTLTIFTISGLAISFVAGATSQIWKASEEVKGRLTKRLTPAGWLSLGISLVGLSGAIASQLIRVNMENDQKLQGEFEARLEKMQIEALRRQEERWRDHVNGMLDETKTDIETNIGNTIRGFQLGQTRFNQAQAALAASKQSLLENSLRQTNQIMIASQPLTSLSLRWQFASANPALWRTMKESEERIVENANDAQGPSTPTPIEAAEYDWQLVPLLSEVARIGSDVGFDDPGEGEHPDHTALALIPLDESQNAMLSFGYAALSRQEGATEAAPGSEPEAEPAPSFQSTLPHGGNIPWASASLAANERGLSHYAIEWRLDPASLANSIHRRNPAVSAMARLPRTLKLALIHHIDQFPVDEKNYSIPKAVNLWGDGDYGRTYLRLGRDLADMRLVLEANGFQAMRYNYRLKRAYRINLRDEYDDELGTGCVVFEFEVV